jgi:hypothetical protein
MSETDEPRLPGDPEESAEPAEPETHDALEALEDAGLDDAGEAAEIPPAATALTGARTAPPPRAARPDLSDRREPLYREVQGYRLRLDPPDLARLRELPGSRGKSDTEIGEAFFDGQADRLAAAVAGDVPSPSELRVVVDPYSRQAFLALENRIRGILSF